MNSIAVRKGKEQLPKRLTESFFRKMTLRMSEISGTFRVGCRREASLNGLLRKV